MSVTTTFGYSAAEDRLWVSCSAWNTRLWLTRRMAQSVVSSVAQVLETVAAQPAGEPAPRGAEGAAREHDASLNQPQPGESGRALTLGRDSEEGAAELAAAPLCTRFRVTGTVRNAELVFGTREGDRSVQLSRVGLHRWLHALQMVLARTDWHEWQAPPEWLTRSYLPPALQNLLTTAAGPAAGDAPPPAA